MNFLYPYFDITFYAFTACNWEVFYVRLVSVFLLRCIIGSVYKSRKLFLINAYNQVFNLSVEYMPAYIAILMLSE